MLAASYVALAVRETDLSVRRERWERWWRILRRWSMRFLSVAGLGLRLMMLRSNVAGALRYVRDDTVTEVGVEIH